MLEVRDLRDCKVCEIEEHTGMIYVVYKRQMSMVELSVDKPYTIERGGCLTVITRKEDNSYKIDHYKEQINIV